MGSKTSFRFLTRSSLALVIGLVGCRTPMPDAGPPATADASGTARAFYQAVRHERIEGLPTEKQMDRLKPFLSANLVSGFAKARMEQKEFMAKNPGEKPPWIEGDLFGSLFEGPTSWSVGTAAVKGASAEVPVKLAYRDDTKPVEWTDRIRLVQTPKGWKVEDIRMGGEWGFKAGGNSLSQTLSAKP